MDGVETLNLAVPIAAPNLPSFARKQDIDVRYAVIPPYSYIHIYWDKEKNELIYEVEEPELDEEEQEILELLEKGIEEIIDVSFLREKTQDSIISYLQQSSNLILKELNLSVSEESYFKLFYYLYRDFIGLNEIESVMRDFFVEDIGCNGINSPIYVVHRLYRNMRTNVIYKDIEKLANFVEKLAQRSGRYVSYATPILDGTLPDGSRVNATYATEITSKGPTFTIRKFTKVPFTPIQLIDFKTLSPEILAYFWLLMEHKSNILIVGGTASGKTTLLNALAFFIPPEARVVSIEDTRELNLPRENWLPNVSRTGLGPGKVGEVSLFDLLKGSFRQNPDYVIVGEVRGQEAYVLFQGMASGHASLSTIHAESVDTVIKRLETPPINLSPTLVNILDVVAVMTHAIVKGKETRKLKQVIEILNVNPDGSATTNIPYFWNPADDAFYFKRNSYVFRKIMEKSGLSQEELLREFTDRLRLLYELYRRNITEFNMVQQIINLYYKDKNAALRQLGLLR
ncbi:MAG: type II/IV secretion system ATPase subunit [Nanoarchaeota archaeon]|nr:type II/IV secretion system ATPase subunit [Nanoarchaeota archaeon]